MNDFRRFLPNASGLGNWNYFLDIEEVVLFYLMSIKTDNELVNLFHFLSDSSTRKQWSSEYIYMCVKIDKETSTIFKFP